MNIQIYQHTSQYRGGGFVNSGAEAVSNKCLV